MAYEDIISLREFARRLGIGEKTIRDGIAKGKIVDGVTYDEKGKPKIKYSVAIIEANSMGLGAKVLGSKEPEQGFPKPRPRELRKAEGLIRELDGDGFEPEDNLPYADALRKKENYIAGLKQLEYLEKRGNLVDKAEVYAQLFEFGKEIRSEFESMPGRISDKLAACQDSSAIAEALANEIRKALSRLIEDLNSKKLTKC